MGDRQFGGLEEEVPEVPVPHGGDMGQVASLP